MPAMKYSMNQVLPPIRVTAEQKAEIARRADAARMTLAAYVRRRGLGEACEPVETAPPWTDAEILSRMGSAIRARRIESCPPGESKVPKASEKKGGRK